MKINGSHKNILAPLMTSTPSLVRGESKTFLVTEISALRFRWGEVFMVFEC